MTYQNDKKEMSGTKLTSLIKQIGLRSLYDEALGEFIDTAKKQRWSPKKIFEQMAIQEVEERERRSLQWRLRDCKIGNFVSMADFDWNWPKKIDRFAIEKLVGADFVAKGENAVLVGTQGLGKTMIAKNIVHNAVHKGHTALFVQAAQMLVDLGSQDSASTLERRLKYYV